MLEGLSKGWVRKDGAAYWIKESFLIDGGRENGAELVSIVPAGPDESHLAGC